MFAGQFEQFSQVVPQHLSVMPLLAVSIAVASGVPPNGVSVLSMLFTQVVLFVIFCRTFPAALPWKETSPKRSPGFAIPGAATASKKNFAAFFATSILSALQSIV